MRTFKTKEEEIAYNCGKLDALEKFTDNLKGANQFNALTLIAHSMRQIANELKEFQQKYF
jgi:hypothetical protein